MASWFPFIAAVGIGATAAGAPSDAISLVEKPGHTTEGVVTVDAPPDAVYALATDYGRWQQMFSDVSAVKVESGGRDSASVWFDSKAIGHRVLVKFDNVPGQTIRFRGIKGPPGGKASGEYRLEPIDGGKRTRIVAELSLDIEGPVGWFVREGRLRTIRHAKLTADLRDFQRYFAAAVGAR